MIRLTQTRMKIHHASSIRPIKNKLFTDENKQNQLKGEADNQQRLLRLSGDKSG
jgi:hypothetical protein